MSGLATIGKIAGILETVVGWLQDWGIMKKTGQKKLEENVRGAEDSRGEITQGSEDHKKLSDELDKREQRLPSNPD